MQNPSLGAYDDGIDDSDEDDEPMERNSFVAHAIGGSGQAFKHSTIRPVSPGNTNASIVVQKRDMTFCIPLTIQSFRQEYADAHDDRQRIQQCARKALGSRQYSWR